MTCAEQLLRDVREALARGEPAREGRERLWGSVKDVEASLAARYTRHAPDLREDFLSEGYLKFEQVLASFDPARGVPFRGYLSGCVERHFHDRVRKRRDLPCARPPERAAEDDPLGPLVARERAALVREALAGLLPRDRDGERKLRAFRLRDFDGWSLEAIREAVGAPTTNTVAQWAHRVRKALAEELRRRGPGLPEGA